MRHVTPARCRAGLDETGSARSTGIRPKDDHTATPDDEDLGTFSTYAGPVRRKKGYRGKVYSYMKTGGRVVIDSCSGVGSCNSWRSPCRPARRTSPTCGTTSVNPSGAPRRCAPATAGPGVRRVRGRA
ncbi:hypothetical protein GCM10023335_47720 [Streptomyces siamensis]|uniref:Uncharacterized protein n=1 Tax=Streptomyces siamensis TaxID=1274986 RepID=A0ABP9J399_9ACTN